MSNVAIIEPRRKSVVLDMADRFGMEAKAFEQTLRATVFPANAPPEQFAAFLLVAKEYSLNPVTKEIYAFPAKGGGIVPVVSIDGWMNVINSNPQFDGMDFEDHHDESGELVSVKCTMYRKDRDHPVSVTEYLKECVRNTEPWKMKHRMLRHKAAIQCARYAFSLSGIYDEDEARVIANAAPVAPTPPPPPAAPAIENKAAPSSDMNPEAIIAEFTQAAADAKTGEELEDAFMRIVDPHWNSLRQEDADQIEHINRVRSQELEP